MTRHLTDREILRDLDAELSESEGSAIARHLAGCDACTARRAAMKSAAAAATMDYRAGAADDSSARRSRARLEIALEHAARETDRPLLAFAPAIAAATVVAIAAAVTVHLNTSQESSLAVHRGFSLPVASITPGATWDVSVEELCSGATRTGLITPAMRTEVLLAYGVQNVQSEQYELDYLITPELGGATDARNLWPQHYGSPVWNARVKDELEDLLPQLVCSHQVDLATAQRDIAADWIAAYKKYFKTDRPLDSHRGPLVVNDEAGGIFLVADAGPAEALGLIAATRP